MTNGPSKLEQALRQHNQSVTGPRLAVFDYLSNRGPVGTFELVSECLDRADRASIYRTLALFRQLGVIQDMVVGGRKVIELSDSYSGHHHHLYCTSCGKSVDLTDQVIERRITSLADSHGFKSTSHQIEVSGLCGNCQN